jgi:hypothetical protein
MGTPFEQNGPQPVEQKPPEGLNPLAKLGWQIRLNKVRSTFAFS